MARNIDVDPDLLNTRLEELRPHMGWHGAGEHEHFVQFYDNDTFLLDAVSQYVEKGLRLGDGCLLIATEDHQTAVDQILSSRGIDVAGFVASGQYISLDAVEILSRFMVDGTPDTGGFEAAVTPRLQQLASGGRRVRAFGEMVTLLWRAGQHAAAVRLEDLWNDLGSKQRFSLLCAYQMNGFDRTSDAAAFGEICRQHSRVLPSESYADIGTETERLREIAILQQKARSLEAEIKGRRAAETTAAAYREKLRDSERKFRLLANTIPQLAWMARPDGWVFWYNEQWYKYTGTTPEKMDGWGWQVVHHPDQLPKVLERWRHSLSTGETFDLVFSLRRADGQFRPFLTRVEPLRDNGGEILLWLGTNTDISEQQRQEQLAKDSAERLRAVLTERQLLLERERATRAEAEHAGLLEDEFLTTLSHELRTPLNAILGWSELLRSQPIDSATISQGLEIIERNAHAQAQMIADLLEMTRIVTRKVRLDLERVNLAFVLEEAIATVRPVAAAKEISIALQTLPFAGPIMGDPSRIRQVFWNLFSNAIKFTSQAGQVQVVVKQSDSEVEVSVTDTGEGIAAEFLPYVFDRFRQADSSTARRHGGLGLGLSIVRQLVELHGGSVRADSPGLGLGARFVVTFPIAATRSPTQPFRAESLSIDLPGMRSPDGQVDQLDLTGVRVLCVDDEPDSRLLVAQLLRERHADVVTATSAVEAIELIIQSPPDVLVSDIGMPVEDGYWLMQQVCRLAPNHTASLPAIALSAYARPEDEERAILAGFQMHASKPVEPVELVAKVAKLAGRRSDLAAAVS